MDPGVQEGSGKSIGNAAVDLKNGGRLPTCIILKTYLDNSEYLHEDLRENASN